DFLLRQKCTTKRLLVVSRWTATTDNQPRATSNCDVQEHAMNGLLTSFGIGMRSFKILSEDPPAFSLFYRMPPLMLEDQGTFRLDYSALFLFDRVIVDEQTYRRAIHPELEEDVETSLAPPVVEMLRRTVAEYAEVLRALHSGGRLVTSDFDADFRRLEDLWTETMDADLRDVGRWAAPFHQSVTRWDAVAAWVEKGIERFWRPAGVEAMALNVVPYRPHALTPGDRAQHLLGTLKNWKKRQSPEAREEVRSALRDYLAY